VHASESITLLVFRTAYDSQTCLMCALHTTMTVLIAPFSAHYISTRTDHAPKETACRMLLSVYCNLHMIGRKRRSVLTAVMTEGTPFMCMFCS